MSQESEPRAASCSRIVVCLALSAALMASVIAGVSTFYANPILTAKRLCIGSVFAGLVALVVIEAYRWGQSIQQRRLKDGQNRIEALVVGMVILVSTLVGGLVEMLALATFSTHGFHGACIGILGSLAALMAGVFVGFLFGIPKVTDSSAQSPADGATLAAKSAARGPRLETNTNLTQISDWLTKIIVGVGLVELKKTIIYFNQAATSLGGGLGLPVKVDVPVGASIIIYFLLGGFLGGYNLTRLFLAGAFMRADSVSDLFATGRHDALKQLPVGDWDMLKDDAPPEAKAVAAQIIDEVQFDLSMTADEMAIWAKAKLTLGKPEEAQKAYESALRLAPRDSGIRFEYTVACFAMDRDHPEKQFDALRQIYDSLQPTDSAELRKNVMKALTYSALHLKAPASFELAVPYGEKYADDPRNLQSGGVFINLACAYGQWASHLIKSAGIPLNEANRKQLWFALAAPLPTVVPPATATSSEQLAIDLHTILEPRLATVNPLDAARTQALKWAQKASEIDPIWILRLQELLGAEPGTGDDDLAVFTFDPAFRRVAGFPI